MTPLDYMARIVGKRTTELKITDSDHTACSILYKLVGTGIEAPQDNVIYVANQKGEVLACLAIKDGEVQCRSDHNLLGHSKVDTDLYFPSSIDYLTDPKKRYPELVEDLEKFLKKINEDSVVILEDDLQTNFQKQTELDEQIADTIKRETKETPEIQLMCERATQQFVLPALAFRENMGNIVIKDDDMRIEGNCVETSCALALNSIGGVNGSLVIPRMRIEPNYLALRSEDVTALFYKVDPLSHQSTANRVFGNEKEASGFGAEMRDVELDSRGSIVSVYGHTFFARKEGDDKIVYDLAMGYIGPMDTYSDFLRTTNVSPLYRRHTNVTEYSQERTNFFRALREMYHHPDVINLAAKIYVANSDNQGLLEPLFESWNKALTELAPELFRSEGYINIEDHVHDPENIRPDEIISLLENTDKGFITLNTNITSTGDVTPTIIFKSGDNVFFADGAKPKSFEIGEIGNHIKEFTNISYSSPGKPIEHRPVLSDPGR